MAISINWLTRVIFVPRADLGVIQLTPTEVRELPINWFRLQLKDIEDDDGMPFQTTHNHYPEVNVGGLVLARVIEILPPYTVTFEDGQYAVNLTGANSNIADRVNPNQVSIRSFNSAGMTSSPLIEHASYNGVVTIDTVSGSPGTIFPIGTPNNPVNNLDDAILIAEYRGFDKFHLLSALTIATGQDVGGYTFHSDIWSEVTVETGVGLVDTTFERVSLTGVMGGYWNVLVDCWVYDITNFCGWVRGGSIENVTLAPYTAENLGQSYFDDLVPMYPGLTSTITFNTNTHVSITESNDIMTFKSLTAGSDIECGLQGGEAIIHSTCTGGNITLLGVGVYTNNSALVVDDTGLVNQDTVADAAWDEATAGHVTAGTTGKALIDAGAAGNPWSATVAGNTDAGTFGELVGKKLLTIAKFLGLK